MSGGGLRYFPALTHVLPTSADTLESPGVHLSFVRVARYQTHVVEEGVVSPSWFLLSVGSWGREINLSRAIVNTDGLFRGFGKRATGKNERTSSFSLCRGIAARKLWLAHHSRAACGGAFLGG